MYDSVNAQAVSNMLKQRACVACRRDNVNASSRMYGVHAAHEYA